MDCRRSCSSAFEKVPVFLPDQAAASTCFAPVRALDLAHPAAPSPSHLRAQPESPRHCRRILTAIHRSRTSCLVEFLVENKKKSEFHYFTEMKSQNTTVPQHPACCLAKNTNIMRRTTLLCRALNTGSVQFITCAPGRSRAILFALNQDTIHQCTLWKAQDLVPNLQKFNKHTIPRQNYPY